MATQLSVNLNAIAMLRNRRDLPWPSMTGLGRIALILKDTMNGKPAPENVGEETSRLYMPTEVRVTVPRLDLAIM